MCSSGVMVAIAWVINSVAAPSSTRRRCGEMVSRPTRARHRTNGGGFGAGSVLTVVPLAGMIEAYGYEAAFLWFGLGQGIVVMLVARVARAAAGRGRAPTVSPVRQGRRDYAPATCSSRRRSG